MAETRQQVVFLKNGMGTVNAEDYDEKVHGKKRDLTDEEYDRLMAERHTKTQGSFVPPTTITNLRNVEGNAALNATRTVTPVPPPPPVAAPSEPVATLRDLKEPEKVDEKIAAANAPGATITGPASVTPQAPGDADSDTK
jgi:hypothetical protein